MPIKTQNKPDSLGFHKLLSLQDSTEKMITEHPDTAEAVRATMWKIYENGQDAGMIQGLLKVAKTMQLAGFSATIITQITGLPAHDLAMWEEAYQADKASEK